MAGASLEAESRSHLEAEIGIGLGTKEIFGEPPGQVERNGVSLGGLAENLERGEHSLWNALCAEDPHHLPGKTPDLWRPPSLQVKPRKLKRDQGNVVGDSTRCKLFPNPGEGCESFVSPSETCRDPAFQPAQPHQVQLVT